MAAAHGAQLVLRFTTQSAILLYQLWPSVRPSVRPSVCLSVCPSNASTVSKRMTHRHAFRRSDRGIILVVRALQPVQRTNVSAGTKFSKYCPLSRKRYEIGPYLLRNTKSACMRFGPRYKKNVCANVVVSGALINCVTSSRYLGVYLESCTKFKRSFASNKSQF